MIIKFLHLGVQKMDGQQGIIWALWVMAWVCYMANIF